MFYNYCLPSPRKRDAEANMFLKILGNMFSFRSMFHRLTIPWDHECIQFRCTTFISIGDKPVLSSTFIFWSHASDDKIIDRALSARSVCTHARWSQTKSNETKSNYRSIVIVLQFTIISNTFRFLRFSSNFENGFCLCTMKIDIWRWLADVIWRTNMIGCIVEEICLVYELYDYTTLQLL